MKRHNVKAILPQVTGELLPISLEDEEEIWQRAVKQFNKLKAQMAIAEKRRIRFEHGPIALCFGADLHLGGAGVDYERIERELKLIAGTPNMYLALLGDLIDNFILPKLVHARWDSTVTPSEEWILLRRTLRLVIIKLLLSVGGNHEGWISALTGIDLFKDEVEQVKQNRTLIYDYADIIFRLQVGRAEFPIRLRHKWSGSSIYNLTHGIERSQKWDQNFLIGVGAHTHASGACRGFDAGGKLGMAVLCGSYKVYDRHARAGGFAQPNGSTIQTIIFFEDGTYFGIENLELAVQVMRVVSESPELGKALTLVLDDQKKQWQMPKKTTATKARRYREER